MASQQVAHAKNRLMFFPSVPGGIHATYKVHHSIEPVSQSQLDSVSGEIKRQLRRTPKDTEKASELEFMLMRAKDQNPNTAESANFTIQYWGTDTKFRVQRGDDIVASNGK
jgi:hypothetical protein